MAEWEIEHSVDAYRDDVCIINELICLQMTVITSQMCWFSHPHPSSRQHLNSGVCLEDKREDNQNCSVLCCVWQLCTMIRTHMWTVLTFLHVRFTFLLCVYLGFVFCVLFHVSLGHFVLVLLAFCCVGFSFFQYLAKRLAGKNISEMTCFVSHGM